MRLAASRYIARPFGDAAVTREDLAQLLGHEGAADITRLGEYYQAQWHGGWGRTADGDWHLRACLAHVRMERVASAWEYVEKLQPCWRGELQEVEPVHTLLLRAIYERWRKDGNWPLSVRVIIEERGHGDVQTLLREVPHTYLQGRETHGSPEERYILTLDGVDFIASGREAELFVRVLCVILQHHVETVSEGTLSAEEIARKLSLLPIDVNRLKHFFWQERHAGVRLSEVGDSWSARGSENLLCWEGTASYEAYKARRDELEQREQAGLLERLNTFAIQKDREAALDDRQLHPSIDCAARAHFLGGQYRSAVFDAAVALEVQVGAQSGRVGEIGVNLMSQAFSPEHGTLHLRALSIDFDREEQRGWMYLFMGAMAAVRNRPAHWLDELEPLDALERLSFLSLLMRKLKGIEVRRGAGE